MKLNQIARVFTGQTFRGKVNSSADGVISVIQMRDIDFDSLEITNTAQKIHKEEISSNQLLQPNDILFLAKGNNNMAVIYHEGYPAITTSLFLVIRLIDQSILPEYLVWVLNNTRTQAALNALKSGATVGNIRKIYLEELQIPKVSKKMQQNIAKLYHLSNREKLIAKQLMEQKELLLQNQLTTIVYERQ
jgi:restriction endonuclease S subunit